MSGEEEFVEALRSRMSDDLQTEMRKQLGRNPAADRRGLLDMALRFERQKIEKIVRVVGAEARNDVVAAANALLDEIGSEIRARL